jgi:hypothetical protein
VPHRPVLFAVFTAALLSAGCQASDPAAPPMVTPALTISRAKVALGTPVDMTYKFVVAPDAKITSDYTVMVHFADQDEQLMYTDDHTPPKPTSQWKPGETIEYTRTFFTPVYPYVGPTTVEIGMFAANEKLRMPMAGTDTGHRSYRIATFQLVPQNEGVQMIYRDGFHAVEGAAASGTGWHWTKKQATFAVTNPKKDSVFYFDVDNPSALLNAPQQVTVTVNGMTLAQFTVAPRETVRRKITIPASTWGNAERVDLVIDVDKTFIPSVLSPESTDPRELGIRVLHAAIVAP